MMTVCVYKQPRDHSGVRLESVSLLLVARVYTVESLQCCTHERACVSGKMLPMHVPHSDMQTHECVLRFFYSSSRR